MMRALRNAAPDPRVPVLYPGVPVRLVALLGLLLALLAASVPAARAEPKPAASGDDVPLVVHNREIFVFRSTLNGYSPEERAHTAQRRLQRVLEKGLQSDRVRCARGRHTLGGAGWTGRVFRRGGRRRSDVR